jgi:hypothetical protein
MKNVKLSLFFIFMFLPFCAGNGKNKPDDASEMWISEIDSDQEMILSDLPKETEKDAAETVEKYTCKGCHENIALLNSDIEKFPPPEEKKSKENEGEC